MFCLLVVGVDYRARVSVLSSELAELGPPPSPPQAIVYVSPLGPKGGRSNTSLWVKGWGDPVRTTGKKAWTICILWGVVGFGTFD